jgi:DNA-directed RNA polymerase specialized sigma24 family protein
MSAGRPPSIAPIDSGRPTASEERSRARAAFSGLPLLQVLHAAQAGDRVALRALLERLYWPVKRWVHRRAPVPRALLDEFGDDVAAESLAHIARSYRECRAEGEGQLFRWAFTIAKRAALDVYRSSVGKVFLACLREEDHAFRGGLDPSWARPGPILGPADRVLSRLLHRAYDSLTPVAAELLWRRLIGAQTWAELAAFLGTTVPGARRRYQRLRDRLRRVVRQSIRALQDEERTLIQAALAARRPRRASRGGGEEQSPHVAVDGACERSPDSSLAPTAHWSPSNPATRDSTRGR